MHTVIQTNVVKMKNKLSRIMNKKNDKRLKSQFILISLFYNLASFLLSRLSFTANDNSQDSREKTDHHHSSLSLQPARKYSVIYLLLCTWDNYFFCVCVYALLA